MNALARLFDNLTDFRNSLMRSLTTILIILILLIQAKHAQAQTVASTDSSNILFLGTKFQSGFVWRDNRRLENMQLNNPKIFQVDFSVLKNRQRNWDYCGCFTKNGVSLSYYDFGNARQLGHAVNLMLFTEPYIVYSKKIQLTLRAGAGLSFLDKIYNAEKNPNNVSFSKHVSFLLVINPNVYFFIGERTRLSIGAQFNHISNGGTRWPNWGLNLISAGVGAAYTLRSQPLIKRETTPFNDRSIKFITHIFGGSHHSDATGQWTEKKRMVGGLNVGLVKPVGRINAFGLGGEYYYDGISNVLEAQSGKNYHLFVGSISLQHYFIFGKLLFGQQLAYYITPANPNVNSKLYQRYILEYKIKNPWYAGISLRAHGKISDYLTLSTGFVF
jgi:hypothetical protein